MRHSSEKDIDRRLISNACVYGCIGDNDVRHSQKDIVETEKSSLTWCQLHPVGIAALEQ